MQAQKSNKYFFDDVENRRLLILSKGRGILDPVLFKNFIKLVDNSYWTFCQDIDNMGDIKQEIYLKLLEVWDSYDERKADPFVYFSEIIKRSIFLTLNKLSGRKKGARINPVWISIDKIFSNDDN